MSTSAGGAHDASAVASNDTTTSDSSGLRGIDPIRDSDRPWDPDDRLDLEPDTRPPPSLLIGQHPWIEATRANTVQASAMGRSG